jgi:hypothetical protein
MICIISMDDLCNFNMICTITSGIFSFCAQSVNSQHLRTQEIALYKFFDQIYILINFKVCGMGYSEGRPYDDVVRDCTHMSEDGAIHAAVAHMLPESTILQGFTSGEAPFMRLMRICCRNRRFCRDLLRVRLSCG